MAQTSASQLGPTAVAHPAGTDGFPPSAPDLHHLKNVDQDSSTEDPSALVFNDLPPFPDDVPTAPLLRLSLKKLVEGDTQEEEKLWKACCELGFFYLDLRGAVSKAKRDSAQDLHSTAQEDDKDGVIDGDGLLQDADTLFGLGEKLFQLPVEEKQKYDFKPQGSYFGYKGYGTGIVDAAGTRDRNEFYNVSKDDMLSISKPWPAPELLEEQRPLFKSYMQRSHAIVSLVLAQLNERLGLPDHTLQKLHRLRGTSGDQLRWVSAPPQPMDDRKMALGEHTDFGSLTILFNRLGGLQVLPPGQEHWSCVKPLKNHCVVNLGDAMVKFTAGILRSNIHRVVSAPGEQGNMTRMSLVYFARPENEVLMKVLEGSESIDAKRRETVEFKGEEEVTAETWILRRAFGRRVGGDFNGSDGTEGDRVKG